MKKRIISKLSIGFIITLVIMLAGITVFADDAGIAFKDASLLPGSTVEVVISDYVNQGEIQYKWYADGKKIGSSTNQYTLTDNNLEKIIKVEVYDGTKLIGSTYGLCSKLPVTYINIDNGEKIDSKEEYKNADLKMVRDNKEEYNGRTEIKGHGNSTWTRYDKKSYKLKLDKSTDLMEMGKNKHWLLIANYIDATVMRNKLSTEVADILGALHLDCTWTDVVVNGEKAGNYVFFEQARISKDRVNIYDWESEGEEAAKKIAKKEKLSDEDKDALKTQMTEGDMSWISTGTVKYGGKTYPVEVKANTGGFLMEMDNNYDEVSKFETARSVPIMFKKPEYICTDDQTMSYIQNYVQLLENAFYSADGCVSDGGSIKSYRDYCETDTLVPYWLTTELLFNELGHRSTYFYKDVDSKICFGPVWDFDWSANAVAPYSITPEEKWYSNNRNWFGEAMKDPYLVVKARELYLEKYDSIENTSEDIVKWKELVKESAIENSRIWPYSRSFEEDCAVLGNWLGKRMTWLNTQMETPQSLAESFGAGVSTDVKVSIEGDSVIDSCNKESAYYVNKDSENVTLRVETGECAGANIYINGRFYKSVEINNGECQAELSAALFDEEQGKQNTVSIWTKDASGNLLKNNFITVTQISSAADLCDIYIVDGGNTDKYTVVKGSKFIVPGTGKAITADTGKVIDVTGNKLVSTKISVKNCRISHSRTYTVKYKGKSAGPTIKVYYNGLLLTKDKEYTIEYKNSVNIGFGTYIIKGVEAAGFTGTAELSYRIIPRDMSDSYVKTKLDKKYYVYTGKEIKPVVSITLFGTKAVEGVDYDLSYSDNTAAGTGKILITGKGNFTGTREITFDIVKVDTPAMLSAKTVNARTAAISWKKANLDTYKVYRSTSKDGKYVYLGRTSRTSYTDKARVPGKTYWYKVKGIKGEYEGDYSKTIKSAGKKLIISGVKAKSSKSNVTVSWNKTKGADGYKVYRQLKGSKKKVLLKTIKTSNKYVDKKAKKGKKYTYSVKAYVKIGSNNYYSNIKSYTVKVK